MSRPLFRRQMSAALAARFSARLTVIMSRTATPSGTSWTTSALWRAFYDNDYHRPSMIELGQWRRPTEQGRGPARYPSRRQVRALATIFDVPESYFLDLDDDAAQALIADRKADYWARDLPIWVLFEKEIAETEEGRELVEWARENRLQFFGCSRGGGPESYAAMIRSIRAEAA